MKKFSLLLIILLCPIVLFGCTLGSSKIEDYMSELTKVFFKGTDVDHPNIRASISVGTRETPYKIDGIHQKTCDFSLISINFNEIFDEETIKASITINEESKEIELYYNPINSSYMNDLGYALNDTDTITLIYNDYNITFTNITKDFKVDYKKAIEHAKDPKEALPARYLYAGLCEGQGKLNEAIDEYLKISDYDDNNPVVFLKLAELYEKTEGLTAAIQTLERGRKDRVF